jgi:enamine deaminase RidA (YjgF/YER057c/UK114 family)
MHSVNRPGDPAFERYQFDAAQVRDVPARQLVTSGQVGLPATDMAGQIAGALDNLGYLLERSGFEFADITRLGLYTTDVESFVANWSIVRDRFLPGPVAPNTLMQVVRFTHPAVLVEIEASAGR